MIRKSTVKKRFLTQVLLAIFVFLSSAFGFEISNFDQPSNPYSEVKAVSSGEFSVLTYNIAGLPELISSAATKRAPSIAEIGRRINQFDIVNVQEDFSYNKQLYADNKHPFRTDSKGNVPFGDGLNTLSKFPIHQMQRVAWNDCTGADCLTPKGFTYSRVEIAQNRFVDFYNVHTNAYNHIRAAEARRNNIRQLSKFISENSKNQAVIVMGDLNGHYSYHYDNIQSLLTDNDLQDSWMVLIRKDQLPISSKDLPESNILNLNSDTESIDKIFYRSSEKIKFTPSAYNLENKLFNDKLGRPLSDHHPVGVVFQWQVEGALPEILAKNND